MTRTVVIEKTSFVRKKAMDKISYEMSFFFFGCFSPLNEPGSVNEILRQTSFHTNVWFIVQESNKLTLKIISGF